MIRIKNKLLLLTLIYIGFSISSPAYADGMKLLKKHQCASCHSLAGAAPDSLSKLWQRKAPDLFYAGDKYRQAWIEKWLQNPKRIRPTGMYYMNHIKTGKKRNMVDQASLTKHVKLDALEAKGIASELAKLTTHSALIKAEKHNPNLSPGPLGEMMFDKIYGCMACHQIEPGYGGMSGSEVYTAGERLKPEFMLSYIRNPQAWDEKIWMPNAHLPDNNVQKLVNYIRTLSGENFNE